MSIFVWSVHRDCTLSTVRVDVCQVDNTKLFYVWVFGSSGFICATLERWWFGTAVPKKPSAGKNTDSRSSTGLVRKLLVALLYVSLIFSGVL